MRAGDVIGGPQRVLFICTGNYYRSRFAEAVFNFHARARGLAWTAFSRGLAIHLAGGDLSEFAACALETRGIPVGLTAHTRSSLRETDLLQASRSIALKRAEHYPMMRAQFPVWADRITYWNVHDLDQWRPETALPAIERNVADLLDELGDQANSARPSSAI